MCQPLLQAIGLMPSRADMQAMASAATRTVEFLEHVLYGEEGSRKRVVLTIYFRGTV